LQNLNECGKISTNKRRVVCPVCRKQTLLFVTAKTEAKNLPVWCKRCNREVVLNILPEPEPESLSH
jgi:transcription elongation factor Elf1